MRNSAARPACRAAARLALLIPGLLSLGILGGCGGGPTLLRSEQQGIIDRSVIEYPPNTELKLYISGLTAPTAITWDNEGSMLIAEGGIGGHDPRIVGYKKDGTFFQIYPRGTYLPFKISMIVGEPFRIRGPIAGMVAANGKIYVSHRDENDQGMITAFGYDGSHQTIIARLPAEGDYSVTDLAIQPGTGRLYFGMGSATNSGVVGLDNLRWVRDHRDFHDQPWGDLHLLGRRFDTPNPFAGILGGSDIAVTGPFQAFARSKQTLIPGTRTPNAAIFSLDSSGGDLQVEAQGIRNPVGLGFSETGTLFFTNQGMKLRGTRPVAEDPDVMLRLVHGQWYGWPDFSANLLPIRDKRFQPPENLLIKYGYPDLSFLLDHDGSGLTPPNPNSNLLMGEFPPYSGAAKFDFAPASGFFSRLRQAGNIAIVAMMGDRAPFDTSGGKVRSGRGYRLVQVNVDDRSVRDFVRNTSDAPASQTDGKQGMERPIDAKFGPDGALYIVDFGRLDMKGSRERVLGGTGRIYRLVGVAR